MVQPATLEFSVSAQHWIEVDFFSSDHVKVPEAKGCWAVGPAWSIWCPTVLWGRCGLCAAGLASVGSSCAVWTVWPTGYNKQLKVTRNREV